MREVRCRFCDHPLRESFADLGMSPLANSYVKPDDLGSMECFYPLHARVCSNCFLVQVEEFKKPENIFSDYAYFSSFSDSWLEHCRRYCRKMTAELGLGAGSLVVEVASNDGYLLQYFKADGIPVLGVEPAANVARAAVDKGIPTRPVFFGRATAAALAAEGRAADLIVANNVLAHVPDINDFVAGLKLLLKPGGVITVEFPHLLNMMLHNQFDTIYHEHFSYLSFTVVEKIFAAHGLRVYDVEELSTHGGSLRIHARHEESGARPVREAVTALRRREEDHGLSGLAAYRSFQEQVKETKFNILEFFLLARRQGRRVLGYGAPAKGNTLLTYCGIGPDFMEFTVDRSPHKQGLYLPGTHIPVKAPDAIFAARPDYVLILPWNLREEIMEQMRAIRDWGGKFVVPIPRIEIV